MKSLSRVAVVGDVGVGKTTLAREIARRIGAPHVELDTLRYSADWMSIADQSFRQAVADRIGADRWVVDGNYADVQDLIWIRAQILVWLDFPLHTVLWRLFRRTGTRLWTDEEFSTGQREQLARVFSRNSIVLWAIRSHRRRRNTYQALLSQPRYAHLQFVRLRSPSEVRRWLSRQFENNAG